MQNILKTLPLHSSFIPSVDKGMTSGHKYMIMLHGRGDSMESYKVLASEINVTGLNYILLNAPAKIDFGYSWYHDSFDLQDELYCHSKKVLLEIFKTLENNSIALEDVFILGFSQGGRMALDLFYELGARLSGVCALSPRMSTYHNLNQLSAECSKTPLFVAHGENDPIIPFSETQAALQPWLSHFGDSQFSSYEMGHEIDIAEIQALRDWINQKL